MSRYKKLFYQLKEKQQGAFVPFVTIGDPDLTTSKRIIDTMIAAGADSLELGIPFSDPVADGPTIQKANVRALESGVTPNACFELLSQVRAENPDLPIGLLVYANLVYSNGSDVFFAKAAQAGVDSVLIADVPLAEANPFKAAAQAAGIESIYIAPPNANEETLKQVAQQGEGYTYLLSRAGVTGAEAKANMPVETVLAQLKALSAPPALLGFGISSPEQVKTAIEAGAEGAISGSAVVNIIERNLSNVEQMQTELADFIGGMKAATQIG